MSKSLTPKQVRFANLVIAGRGLSDAYRGAYDVSGMAPESVHVEASKLAQHPEVALRIQAGRLEAANDSKVTLTELVGKLRQAYATAEENGNAAAMTSATVGLARVTGFLSDKPPEQGVAEVDTTDTAALVAQAQDLLAKLAGTPRQ